MRIKDDEVNKLREDNKNMFSDLKDLSQNEESLKLDIITEKNKRQEVEGYLEDLREKTTNQEIKIWTLQAELEKFKRETSLKTEQNRMAE